VIIGVVITLVVLLAIAVVVGVARDPGPDPADVAIGYARALGVGDFDAVYRLVDPELLKGRNRPQWVDEQNARPHLEFAPDTVESRGRVWVYVDKQLKPVNLRLGITDGTNTELLSGDLQQGAEVVTTISGMSATRAAAPASSGNPLLPQRGGPGRGR